MKIHTHLHLYQKMHLPEHIVNLIIILLIYYNRIVYGKSKLLLKQSSWRQLSCSLKTCSTRATCIIITIVVYLKLSDCPVKVWVLASVIIKKGNHGVKLTNVVGVQLKKCSLLHKDISHTRIPLPASNIIILLIIIIIFLIKSNWNVCSKITWHSSNRC